jgi:hypothetical protein
MILSASSDGEIVRAFETLVQQHVAALAIGGAPFFDTRRAKLLACNPNIGCRRLTSFVNTPPKAE